MVQASVLKALGTPNSQVRGGLGHLCTLLPPDELVPALRSVAGSRQKTPQERTTAVLILERFLGETVPAGLLGDLAGSDDVAFQSLLEAIEAGRRNRHVLLEYVTQMQQHGVDVAFMVLDLIDRLLLIDRIELLRLIAQDARPQVAKSALDRLAILAGADDTGSALRALHILRFALPPTLASQAERSLRKQQFSGRRYAAPATNGWRALLSPADPGGYVTLWIVREPAEATADDGVLLGFVLSLHEGILQFSGTEDMRRSYLPASHPVGELVPVSSGGEETTVLLESPLDVGRWLVQSAQEIKWQRGEPQPLGGEYALYNDLIWQFDAPHLPPALEELWSQPAVAENDRPDRAALTAAAAALVSHPAMQGWRQWSVAVWASLQPLPDAPRSLAPSALVIVLFRELSQLPDHGELLHAMQVGLRVQALWFAIAGDRPDADRALLLARWIDRLPITENPWLEALLEMGLRS